MKKKQKIMKEKKWKIIMREKPMKKVWKKSISTKKKETSTGVAGVTEGSVMKEWDIITAIIISHENKKEGKEKQYTLYEIQIKSKDGKWLIYKRYSEIHDFHSKIKKLTTVKKLLSFPRKIIFNLFTKDTIEQRKKDLNVYFLELMKFEKEIITTDELKQSFLKNFLLLMQKKQNTKMLVEEKKLFHI